MVRKIDKVLDKLDGLREIIEGDNAKKAELYDEMKSDLANICVGVAKAAPIMNDECGLDILVHFKIKPSRVAIDDMGNPTMEPFLKSLIKLGILPTEEVERISDAIDKAIKESKKMG